ncbi:hypothetical protein IF188_06375 [Microbacterium sp. NEAU-LLC]|uniref:Lactococcin 972 family bacteriocin n=1 Tax=Microbacterium helvum TaxID=2773713 RepID=A0ABR8NMC1_9MICO|nr:hypothetical protein [Microbacterium helvum]MBD3941324.1 hypothetical protein [Microbacterium helvum]
MKNKVGAVVLAGALAVVFALAPAGAALAVSKTGYKGCGASAPYSWLTSYSTGSVTHKGPGASPSVIFINGTTWTHRYSQGAFNGGSWSVSTGGALDDAGTYAYCTNYT